MNDSRVNYLLTAKQKREDRRSEIFKPTLSNVKGYSNFDVYKE